MTFKKPRKRTKYQPPAQSLKNLKPWPKGVYGNPSGLSGTDVAAERGYGEVREHQCVEHPSNSDAL